MESVKRRCELCNQPLSMYNKGKRCFCHTEGMIIYEYVPKNKCVGKDRESGNIQLFTEEVFEKIPVGVIDKEGKLIRFDKSGE